jgi:hypothetical protein
VAERLAAAHALRRRRFAGRPLPVLGAMEPSDLRRCCELDPAGQRPLAGSAHPAGGVSGIDSWRTTAGNGRRPRTLHSQ